MDGTEIVWVYGNSSAGKETFIKTISEKKPADVLRGLGWTGKEIIPCMESINWVVQAEGDGNEERRGDLPAVIVKLADKPNSVILIKGQNIDLDEDRLRAVKTALPRCKHRTIFINTASRETYERQQKKRWWNSERTLAIVKKHAQDQIERLKKLQSEFEIVTIDGSSKKNYECFDFPPMVE
ncbi:MAG: hypothetical protein HY432_02285 [Candidatus Liptonbacteria bacterium]|nr:hypothetical protein [Candidatus Liptonbacteria bacterium]